MLEFDTGVRCGELPVRLGVVDISVVLPSRDFVDEGLFVCRECGDRGTGLRGRRARIPPYRATEARSFSRHGQMTAAAAPSDGTRRKPRSQSPSEQATRRTPSCPCAAASCEEPVAQRRSPHEAEKCVSMHPTIPGVGFITATAIAATVTDPSHFRSSREFAAWLGLTPRQNSSGGKDRLGRVSKMGNRYLRSLIVVGATAMIRYARDKGPVSARWINGLLEKKPARLVSVAVANKTARIAWALLVRKEDYRVPLPA